MTFNPKIFKNSQNFRKSPNLLISGVIWSQNFFQLRTGHKNKDQNPSIELVRVSNEPVPSLINLIKSGHQFYSTIAFDFTSNNGGPNSSDSLHFS